MKVAVLMSGTFVAGEDEDERAVDEWVMSLGLVEGEATASGWASRVGGDARQRAPACGARWRAAGPRRRWFVILVVTERAWLGFVWRRCDNCFGGDGGGFYCHACQ